MELGEFGLIDRIRREFPAPEGVRGIGDDCAVIPEKDGMETLVSTDMLIDGVHFLLSEATPYQIGWKSAASNFSDIAAMGGTPVGSFLAFALPPDLQEGWVEGFLEGYRAISTKYGFPLLGGDTTASKDRLCICVTVLGEAPLGQSATRDAARPGDLICVTGTLGDSAAGLKAILGHFESSEDSSYLIDRHYLPSPRIAEGKILAGTPGVHAMMDLSDGLGSDIRHILEESHVGASIDASKLPISDLARRFCAVHGIDATELAASGGEDYELLFTMDPDCNPDVPYTVVGRITEGSALTWENATAEYSGFRHF